MSCVLDCLPFFEECLPRHDYELVTLSRATFLPVTTVELGILEYGHTIRLTLESRMLEGEPTPGIHNTDERGEWSPLSYQVGEVFDYVTNCSFAQEPELLRQMSFEQKKVSVNIL